VVCQQNADIADTLHTWDVAMATSFWLSMGYNFGCMIAINMLFGSGGGFVGFRGQAIRRRHSRFQGSKGCCHGKHFFGFCIWGAHWRHLVNTTEPSVCGGDAALCQLTLTTYLL